MNKEEVQQRVLKDGKPLGLELFTWDEATKTFSSKENYLVIDFNGMEACTFKTGSHCTFNTGSHCTFKTGSDCTFNTGSHCTFKTGSVCTFKVNGYRFPVPPMRFNGSRYFIEASGKDTICSGCIEKPINWWKENIRRCAEEHGYTPEQIDEYEIYVDWLAKWFEKFGDKIVKIDED